MCTSLRPFLSQEEEHKKEGQLEYLSQSNDNVDFLSSEEKFKFVDDLCVLKMVNLVVRVLSSYNFKQHVASNIGIHGQYLPIQNILS